MTWRDRAACIGADPGLFHSPAGEATTGAARQAREALAVAICRTCPVIDECLRDALAHDDAWGIRGGLTPEQLESLAKVRRRPGRKPTRARTTVTKPMGAGGGRAETRSTPYVTGRRLA